jgi:hypothetical protein
MLLRLKESILNVDQVTEFYDRSEAWPESPTFVTVLNGEPVELVDTLDEIMTEASRQGVDDCLLKLRKSILNLNLVTAFKSVADAKPEEEASTLVQMVGDTSEDEHPLPETLDEVAKAAAEQGFFRKLRLG